MTRGQKVGTVVAGGIVAVGCAVVGFSYLAGALVADRDGATRRGRLAAKLLADDSLLGRTIIAVVKKIDASREQKGVTAPNDD